jgi:hypothetical protein
MEWIKEFDKIFLINLPARQMRLSLCSARLLKLNIPFELVPGIHLDNGARGLFETMKNLLSTCIHEKYRRILVFEDDIAFVDDPHKYMPWMIDQLDQVKPDWHLFYLGANTHKPLQRVAPNILLAQACRATHALAYSAAGMRLCLQHMHFFHQPIDEIWEHRIQPLGKSFCSFPLLATQADGFSDICEKHQDNSYIISRFNENTRHLKLVET